MVKPKNKISVVNNNTAGIDIGSRKIFIGIADKPAVSFGTFTDDFLNAVTYLKENNITSVAMEATGVYWISLYDILDQSGLTNKKKKFKRHTSAGQIFRLAAQAIAQCKHLALTSFYHRIKSRKGALGAIKATARKIAVIFYNVMTKGIEFVEQGIKLYEQHIKERQLKYLQKQAKRFGLTLTPQLQEGVH